MLLKVYKVAEQSVVVVLDQLSCSQIETCTDTDRRQLRYDVDHLPP